MNIEDVKQHVEEKVDTSTAGKTSLRLDNGVVSDVKSEVGVSQNTKLAPLVEASLLEDIGEDERAEEKLEEFKQQFED